MKRERFMYALAGLALLGACASEGCGSNKSGSGGTGGIIILTGAGGDGSGGATGGGNGGGSTGSGGIVLTGAGGSGAGGTNGSGGATAAGGTTGAGGNATGGSVGAGGVSGSGGKAGASGSTGGSPASGGTTGSGGAATGTGGAGTGTGGAAGGATGSHWVGTWTAAPYVDTNTSNAPPISLANSVIRQVAHVSLGGSQIRVQFSNLDGNASLVINAAHIALCGAAAGALVDSTINTSTDKALTFSGTATVTVAAGKEIWSDPIDFALANQGNLTITTALGSVPSTLTQHSGSRTTSYFQSSSTTVNAANMTSAQKAVLWFFISAIDVMADASAKGTVAIGDSITDGRGSDTDGEDRWTDIMAARLQGNAPTAKVSTMNVGIGGTNLIGTTGTAAQARFAHDVLGQDGVHYVIVLEGVNDIAGGATAQQLETAYMDLISRAHASGLLIYGGTITPFGGDTTGSPAYYTAANEAVREQANAWIKTAGHFDGYIDFDAAITDGGNPPKIQTQYATWAQADGLHPGPAGYKAMGDAVDLTLFTK